MRTEGKSANVSVPRLKFKLTFEKPSQMIALLILVASDSGMNTERDVLPIEDKPPDIYHTHIAPPTLGAAYTVFASLHGK